MKALHHEGACRRGFFYVREVQQMSRDGRQLFLSGMAAAGLHLLVAAVGLFMIMRWAAESAVVYEVFLTGERSVVGSEAAAPAKERKAPVPPRNTALSQQRVAPSVAATAHVTEAAVPYTALRQEAPSGQQAGRSEAQTGIPSKSSVASDVVFGEGTGPRFVRQEQPAYPLLAKKLGKQGRVLLRLSINEKGILTHVEVLEDSGFGFAEAAVTAVRKSSFAPATSEGIPVASRARLPITFRFSN
ncbi:MAG: periplasmic protein TonB [Nitrospirae bacterium]|nr:MAG: periplasmic protein TonB [Nitrospirota bacterium]